MRFLIIAAKKSCLFDQSSGPCNIYLTRKSTICALASDCRRIWAISHRWSILLCHSTWVRDGGNKSSILVIGRMRSISCINFINIKPFELLATIQQHHMGALERDQWHINHSSPENVRSMPWQKIYFRNDFWKKPALD